MASPLEPRGSRARSRGRGGPRPRRSSRRPPGRPPAPLGAPLPGPRPLGSRRAAGRRPGLERDRLPGRPGGPGPRGPATPFSRARSGAGRDARPRAAGSTPGGGRRSPAAAACSSRSGSLAAALAAASRPGPGRPCVGPQRVRRPPPPAPIAAPPAALRPRRAATSCARPATVPPARGGRGTRGTRAARREAAGEAAQTPASGLLASWPPRRRSLGALAAPRPLGVASRSGGDRPASAALAGIAFQTHVPLPDLFIMARAGDMVSIPDSQGRRPRAGLRNSTPSQAAVTDHCPLQAQDCHLRPGSGHLPSLIPGRQDDPTSRPGSPSGPRGHRAPDRTCLQGSSKEQGHLPSPCSASY